MVKRNNEMIQNNEDIIQQKSNDIYEQADASQSVQAYISNFTFPANLDELKEQFYNFGGYNFEDFFDSGHTVWSTPKWTKSGDIVFFMLAKTAVHKINSISKEHMKEKPYKAKRQYKLVEGWINRGRELCDEYGGKIFAIGRVQGSPYYEGEDYDEEREIHWKGRIYASIDSIIELEKPIDLSEFNEFIELSRGGSFTPVFGESFNRLIKLIESKNKLPRYVRECKSIPVPINKINRDNWLEIAGQYRRSFFLEIQFRSFYVDYLLPLLGDQKKIFSECRCCKSTNSDSYVDNVILFEGKYLPVEVKLDINTEKDLKSQVKKYCEVKKCYLDKKDTKCINYRNMFSGNVLIIDTNGVYLYDDRKDFISNLYDLDCLQNIKDIVGLKNKVKVALYKG